MVERVKEHPKANTCEQWPLEKPAPFLVADSKKHPPKKQENGSNPLGCLGVWSQHTQVRVIFVGGVAFWSGTQ